MVMKINKKCSIKIKRMFQQMKQQPSYFKANRKLKLNLKQKVKEASPDKMIMIKIKKK